MVDQVLIESLNLGDKDSSGYKNPLYFAVQL